MTRPSPYVPRLRYVFLCARPRSLWPQQSVMAALNAAGTEPYLLTADPHIPQRVTQSGVRFVRVTVLPEDYDVLFCEGAGGDAYERYWLIQSKRRGKVNVVLYNAIHLTTDFTLELYRPERLWFVDGVCTKDRRTAEHLCRMNPRLFYAVTGDPDWDFFTDERFADERARVHRHYGPKMLVSGQAFYGKKNRDRELSYARMVVTAARAAGYAVVFNDHPEHPLPGEFRAYANPGYHRHALLSAASHCLAEICSTMSSETLFLGTRLGACPSLIHYGGQDVRGWEPVPASWHAAAAAKLGDALAGRIPLVHDERSLEEFLSQKEPNVAQAELDRFFGWPRTDGYCAFLLRTLDGFFGGVPDQVPSSSAVTINRERITQIQRARARADGLLVPEEVVPGPGDLVVVIDMHDMFLPENTRHLPAWQKYYDERMRNLVSFLAWCGERGVDVQEARYYGRRHPALSSVRFTHDIHTPVAYGRYQRVFFCGISLDQCVVSRPSGYFHVPARDKILVENCSLQGVGYCQPLDYGIRRLRFKERGIFSSCEELHQRVAAFVRVNRITHGTWNAADGRMIVHRYAPLSRRSHRWGYVPYVIRAGIAHYAAALKRRLLVTRCSAGEGR